MRTGTEWVWPLLLVDVERSERCQMERMVPEGARLEKLELEELEGMELERSEVEEVGFSASKLLYGREFKPLLMRFLPTFRKRPTESNLHASTPLHPTRSQIQPISRRT